jgi:hypothetical protein
MNPTTDIAADIALGAAFPNRPGENTSLVFTRNQRWLLVAICVVAYFATSFFFGSVMPLFRTPGFGGSLLADASPIISLTITFVWVSIVFAVAAFAGRSVRPDVGLFAVAVAFFAIRRTGGMTRDVYLAHPTGAVLQALAFELVALGVMFGVLFFATRQLVLHGILFDDATLDGVRAKPEPLGQRFVATFAHFIVFCVIVLTVLRGDERMQVTAILAIASLLASICAVRLVPATPSAFFWLGPIIAGIVGYCVTVWVGTNNLVIGEPGGYCAGLARGLPLDFASAGVGGAIYGYWIGRGWIPEHSLEKAKA